MAATRSQKPSSSERLYRCLLLLYPKAFRRIYGQEMLRFFRDCYYAERQANGSRNLSQFWVLVLADLLATAWKEHCKAAFSIVKSLFGIEGQELLMTQSLLNLDVALHTDIGKRASNEDNMTSFVPQDPQVMARKGALFVVADGMGGHTRGDVASELAVNTIRDAYYQHEGDDIAVALRQAVEQANAVIYERNERNAQGMSAEEIAKNGMGTTCVVAVLHDNNIYVANDGDSLAYVIHGDEMRQIAEDHSWPAEQVRKGLMGLEEARAQGKNNMITRCLGIHPTVDVYVTAETVQDGDILVLCTDGLWSQVTEGEVRAIVQQSTPQESVTRLVARANENGGPDNITAVVVRISLA